MTRHRAAALLAGAALLATTVGTVVATASPAAALPAGAVPAIGPGPTTPEGPMAFAERRVHLRESFAANGFPFGSGDPAPPVAPRTLLIGSGSGTAQRVTFDADGSARPGPVTTDDPWTMATVNGAGDALLTRPAPVTGGAARTSQLAGLDGPVRGLGSGVGAQLWSPGGEAMLQRRASDGQWVVEQVDSGASEVLRVPPDVEPTSVSAWGDVAYGLRTTDGGSEIVTVPVPGIWAMRPASTEGSSLGLGAWAPGRPGSGMSAGSSVFSDAVELLAFAGTDPGSGAHHLFVISKGRPDSSWSTPQAVADTGATCDTSPPVFDAARRRLAYVRAVGPAGSECSDLEVRVLTADADGTFTADSADVLATSWPASRGLPTTLGFISSGARAVPAMRVGGPDRVAVSVETSRRFVAPGTARGIVLSGSRAEADALTGGPLAARLAGSSLLTPTGRLPDGVLGEIDRALAADGAVYIVGGTASVGTAVESRLREAGVRVRRLGGPDRYAVAVAVATELDRLRGRPAATALVSSGRAFADALVAGPAAAVSDAPVLLSAGSRMPATTAAYLARLGASATIVEVGGAGSGSVAGDPRAEVIGGATRYDVASGVADRFFPRIDVLTVVDGRNWPDAASAAALAGRWGQPVLLAGGKPAQDACRRTAARHVSSLDYVVALGGEVSIPASVLAQFRDLAGAQGPFGQAGG